MEHFLPYIAYKKSELDWLGLIPSHWEIKSLQYFFTSYVGTFSQTKVLEQSKKETSKHKTAPTKGITDETGTNDMPWVFHADLKQKFVLGTELRINPTLSPHYALSFVPKGALLCSLKNDVGGVAFAGRDLYVGQYVLSIKPQEDYDLSYYYYFLPYILKQYSILSSLGAPLLTFSSLNKSLLLVPPLKEQNRIGQYLDGEVEKISALIEEKKALMALLVKEKKAFIWEAVTQGVDNQYLSKRGYEYKSSTMNGWTVQTLRSLFTLQERRGVTKESNSSNTTNKGSNSNHGPYVNSYKNTMPLQVLKISLYSQGIKVSLDHNASGLNVKALTILPSYKYVLSYYNYCLSALFDKVFDAHSFSNEPFAFVSSVLLSFKIPVPSYNEQKKIAHLLERRTPQMDEVIHELAVQIEQIQTYQTSLIYEAITGKIDLSTRS